jgi:site-specific DNA-methyltransferase (adenine-specific)
MQINQIIQGDCLEVMRDIPDKSIDMILCDLPYGTIACKWDTIIPFEPLWEQYKRIIKDNGAIVLTASQPFTSALVMSNPKMFKYEWVWNKAKAANYVLAKRQPLKVHENIVVFCNGNKYNPQMTTGKFRKKGGYVVDWEVAVAKNPTVVYNNIYYPKSVLDYSVAGNGDSTLHPTQKPVALFEYLIKTYTSVGDTVLDNAAGSGTTGVACKNTNRNFILIEKEPEYIDIINKRLTIDKHYKNK